MIRDPIYIYIYIYIYLYLYGVFLPDFEQGLQTYFDLTVRNSLQPLYIAQAAQHAGVAAEAGEKEDCRREGLVAATGSVIHPLVVESLVLWSPHNLKVIKTITRRLAFHVNLSVSKATTNLHEQLPVKLWLYNAKMLLHRLFWTVEREWFVGPLTGPVFTGI